MTNYSGGLRTTDPKVLAASKPGCTLNQIASKHLVTKGGGSVLVSTRWKTSCSATTPRAALSS